MNTEEKPDRLELSGGQRVLRVLAGGLLTVCAGLVVLGVTVLQGWVQGPLRFVAYWTACLLLALAALGLALWDLMLVRHAFQRRRRQLFREEFMTTELTAKLRDAIRRDDEQK